MMTCPHNACLTRANCTRGAHHTANGCFYSKLRPVRGARLGGFGSNCDMSLFGQKQPDSVAAQITQKQSFAANFKTRAVAQDACTSNSAEHQGAGIR
jgi:hypothetical protein